MRQPCHSRPHQAFSLIELLVVMVIIAVLIGLSVPAVQKVLEVASRVTCQSNLKQIGMAVHNYHANYQVLPPDHIRNEWATWAIIVLPYLDQEPVFRRWDVSLRYWDQPDAARMNNVPVYFCPARRGASSAGYSKGEFDKLRRYHGDFPGVLSDYASCGGSDGRNGAMMIGSAIGRTPAGIRIDNNFDKSPPGTRILSWTSRTSFASIADGTSNTLMIGEKFIRVASANGQREDRSVFNSDNPSNYRRLLGVNGKKRYTLVSSLTADERSWPFCNESFGSQHSGVCQFVMVDGAVRVLSSKLTNPTLQYLAQRNDGQTIPDLDY